MNFNYTLKYRTFDSLLEDVKLDLQNISLEGKIFPEQLYKVALRVNYDLGLRIYMTKETLLDVCHGKAKLPDDFYVMNFALMCGEYTKMQVLPQGTNIQELPYPLYREHPPDRGICDEPLVNCVRCNTNPCGCQSSSCLEPNCPTECPTPEYSSLRPYGDYCTRPRVFLDCKGNSMQLIQVVNTEIRTYKYLYPIRFKKSQYIDCDCPNLNYLKTANEAYIKDGFIYLNVQDANVYINYRGQLEDENGNLLVLDHPEINEYYEYALKKRIYENLIYNGDNYTAQLQLIMSELRQARNRALTIVNTPNFSEMLAVWAMNRKAMYHKYYDMFKSNYWPIDYKINNAV